MNQVTEQSTTATKWQQVWQKTPKPLLILTVGAVLVYGVFALRPAPHTVPIANILPPQVAVVYAQPRVQSLKVNSQGSVAPRHEIDLVTQVAGNIVEVNRNFVEGGFFKAGEKLLKIDARDYQLALIRAEARVAEATQALSTERGRARQAQREWRDLGNEEANQLFLRKPQLAAAEANLAAAEADRDKAKLDLERTVVSAPFDGRVRESSVDIGQYVTPGSRVGKVYDTEVAEIRLPLTDKQAALVELPLGFRTDDKNSGPLVTISGVIAGEQYHWQGHIVRTDASLDTTNRMFYAVVEVIDPFASKPDETEVPLVIGLFVNAEITGREIPNVIEVPRRALFKNNKIYVLDAENKIALKEVRVLMTDKESAWVQGNIANGQAVVVGGQNFLIEGMEVSPQPANELASNMSPL